MLESGDMFYEKGQLYSIETQRLQCDPNQPRKYFDSQSLQELADSISAQGIIQPIIFRKDEGKLIVVAGERRVRAAKKAGVKHIPAIFTDGDHTEIALVENILREDLTAIEEAEALNSLLKKHTYTQDQIAKTLGKARSTVSEILSLNRLPPKVRDECRKDPKCSRRVLVEIAKEKNERQMLKLYEKYKNRRLTGEAIRKISRPGHGDPVAVSLKAISSLLKDLPGIDFDSLPNSRKEALVNGLRSLNKEIVKFAGYLKMQYLDVERAGQRQHSHENF